LKGAVEALRVLDIVGCSVTSPHKSAVIPFLDELDVSARKIGAVNTIKNNGGRLKGYNTDYTGAKQAIRKVCNIRNKEVLMVGAGGAAKAIGWAVKDLGGKLTIINRTAGKAKNLAKSLNARVIPWSQLRSARGYLLINATSVGMHGSSEAVIPKDVVRKFTVIKEVVIDPSRTKLVRDAEALKKKVICGSSMCFSQAAAQFKIYTGHEAPLNRILKIMKDI
jgi:shikimate dehydrogenase